VTARAARDDGDRGAVLIYAAVVMVGLMAMATFVVDFGMFWVARRQAQNAADAAAYAAAVALGQDSSGNRTDAGIAKQTALAIAARNLVWGEAPGITAADISFPTCPVDGTDACVRVAVYRTVARGNPLPTVFGHLIGLTAQDVQAVATAEVRPGNTTSCLKPWAVPDRWTDVTGSPTMFEKYDALGQPLLTPDFYAPPSAHSTGTGYRLDRDLGTQLTLSQVPTCALLTNLGNAACQAQTGTFLPVKLSSGCPGASYQNTIFSCSACAGVPVDVVGVNDPLTFSPGSVAAATQAGVQTLIGLDPNAVYNPVTRAPGSSRCPRMM
jgi:Flp pilus assembly protein TadG